VLADEQAALRRVATLVARGAAPEAVFAAVVEEVGRLLPVDFADMGRYEPDGTLTFVASWGSPAGQSPVGSGWSLEGKNLGTLVYETGGPARMDGYADASGPLGVGARERGFRAAVGTPIVVEGSLWGVMIAGSTREQPMPTDTEPRLVSFTELLATAVANAESRAVLSRLAAEQAALRRVATLVAQGAPAEQVFAAVTAEVARLLSIEYAHLGRYESGRTVTFLAAAGQGDDRLPVGARMTLEGNNVSTLVYETGRPARIDGYGDAFGPPALAALERGVRSSVGAPILVDGRLWGVILVGSSREPSLPAETEAQLASFTELLATALANTESRAGLSRLAEEQAALRRVATLVARGAGPDDVVAAVVQEVVRLLPVEYAHMGRYEPDGTVTIVASWGRAVRHIPAGTRVMLGEANLARLVLETGRPGRMDSSADASGRLALAAREAGVRSSVATPVTVEGRVWGVMSAGSIVEPGRLADTEARLAEFTELVAMAIANAESRAALAASRARIVAATDQVRRRIERDLHDGTQQRLVSLGLELRAALATVPAELPQLEHELLRMADELGTLFDELREISRGIHPAILSERGLGPALRALGRRSPIPVEFDLRAERRLPEPLEVAGYYVVSEAMTNAAKHARATVVHVELDMGGTMLRLAIRDDGTGGADPGRGSGLLGLRDRIEALRGRLQVTSPTGGGTTLLIELPVEPDDT
jgi:GAF domain-containing protein